MWIRISMSNYLIWRTCGKLVHPNEIQSEAKVPLLKLSDVSDNQANHLITKVLFRSMVVQCNYHIVTILCNTWLNIYAVLTLRKALSLGNRISIQDITSPRISNLTLPPTSIVMGVKQSWRVQKLANTGALKKNGVSTILLEIHNSSFLSNFPGNFSSSIPLQSPVWTFKL